MKKFLSALLALALMLLPVLSMAEAATEVETAYETYTHTDGQYSFMYPSSWMLLNAENIQSLMDMLSGSDDEQLAQMIAAYAPQVQQMDMVMVISESGATNVNVVPQYVGMQATDEVLLSLAPALISQLSATMEGIQFVDEGTLIDLGGKSGLMLEYDYEMSGMQIHGAQVYVSGATDLYIFTFTCGNADELVATSEEFGYLLGTLEVK